VDDSGLGNANVITNASLYVWGYNGQTPGPVIEVQQGDNVRILFKNELPEASTFHIDGLVLDWEDDGVGGVTPNNPVAPGEYQVYEFSVTQCGTFLYHSGYQMWAQDQRGLYGLFVVHCPGLEPVANKDFGIIASSYNILFDHDSRNCPAWWRTLNEWYMFNGQASPSIPIYNANAGDVVRMRFINAGSQMTFPIYLHGHQLTLISSAGGQPIAPALRTSSAGVSLPAGVAQDVLFTARAGIWALRSQTGEELVNFLLANSQDPTQRVYPGGMFTLFCVEGMTPGNTTIVCPQL